MHHRLICLLRICLALLPLTWSLVSAQGVGPDAPGQALRLYQGATAYVNNAEGVAFEVQLEVRQWHLLENGPRELLVKVYDPDGQVVHRQVVEDDGLGGQVLLPEAGGWDHEMWYYTLNYARGSQPMMRWSAFADPARLASLPKQTVTLAMPAGKPGIYRILLAGSRDHVASLRLAPALPFGLAGHPLWLHGRGQQWSRAFVYVPRGTVGINLGFAEFDQPVTRHFKLSAPDGTVLWEGAPRGGFQSAYLKDLAGKYDDQVLTVEVGLAPVALPTLTVAAPTAVPVATTDATPPVPATTPAVPVAPPPAPVPPTVKRAPLGPPGDYLMHLQFTRTDTKTYRGGSGVPAIYCPDAATAKALQGGAIYHDGQVFWHMFQVRLHDWVKANLKPEDLIVRDAAGQEIKPTPGKSYGWGAKALEYKGLPERPGFIPLNGNHEPPPLCDQLMHHYVGHKNRNILNLAIADFAQGIRNLVVGDHPAISKFGGNLGYVLGTYGWHYWRPAWRIMQQSDAPPELKAMVKEAMILVGDRLALSAGQERTNGNAMSHIPMALRYAAEGTQDPLLTRLSDIYFERFSTEGWGRGAGISKSGDCQEHFAHDFHYGSYIHANYTAIVNDLNDPKFKAVLGRISTLYGYLYCPEVPAYPWGSRTAQQAGVGRTNWQGQAGEDFTVSVNGGDEWFAARRPSYYALTFHGRLAPEWLNNYFATRLGYGGGMLCQLTVPGQGVVLAGTLHGSYGKNMQRHKWADFHLHGIVGTMADGQPLVAADSEQLNATLVGTTVTSSGEVRDRPLRITRQYRFDEASIAVAAQMADTDYREALWGQGPSARISEAYEMIPYLPGDPKKSPTVVQAVGADGAVTALTANLVSASAVVIDRGGYGVKLEFDAPKQVKLGNQDTVLIQLASQVVNPEQVAVAYTIRPFVGAAPGVTGVVAELKPGLPLARLAKLEGPAKVAEALAAVPPLSIKSGTAVLAQVRLAVAGDALALDAEITDPRLRRAKDPWESSELEIYARAHDQPKIHQIFLLPQVGEAPAMALVAAGKVQEAAPTIQVQSEPTKTGYRLQALIPLALLGLAPTMPECYLEFQVSSAASAAANSKLVYATLFGSRFAYENSRAYGRFSLAP